MSVPAIALYATPPGGVCSPDYDLNPKPSTSPSVIAHKPVIGGLSRLCVPPQALCSSNSVAFPAGDEVGSDIGCSHLYSSLKCRDQSPMSVFQGPMSGSRSSPPLARIPCEFGDFRAGRDRLFSGFVRNALGSCLDYDTPGLPVQGDLETDPEEFAFDMGYGHGEGDCEPYAKEMLCDAQSRHGIFRDEFVVKAFYEAEVAHRGQMRASGDPYLKHCVETAIMLAEVGANEVVVAGGLLHDTIDDSFMNYDYIVRTFGPGVAKLVAGVSKLSHLSKLGRDNDIASRTVEADRMHTMFLAMADARAVLIKLADRLHNMMTLDALPVTKQQRFAKETLEIFVPLANRLGIFSWKERLEDLCFKHLYPGQYNDLASKLVKTYDEAMIASAKEKLENVLDAAGISYCALFGRHKSLYSIHTKMLKKNLTMDGIHDIHGLRLIVENESDCYKARDVVHSLWSEVAERSKDYIINPKINGYRSLHTVVLSNDTVPLEVQIRTKEMHLQAEIGFAAHWRYKEREEKHPSFVLQMVEWARWVLTWQCEIMSKELCLSFWANDTVRLPCPFPCHSPDCPFSYKPYGNHDGPVFVILLENEKMSVQEFPADSTLKDMMERVGPKSAMWNGYSFPLKEELRPKLNNKPAADPDQKLKMGDMIELTPSIPDKSLTEYREEIQRMYNQGLAVSGRRS